MIFQAGAYLAASLAVALSFGVLFWTRKRFEGRDTATVQPYDDRAVRAALDSLSEALGALHAEHADTRENLRQTTKELTLAIAEGIERVDRSERRVRSAVGRAKKRLEDAGFEDAGVDAEAESLRYGDGGGSDGQGVLPLRASVGEAPNGHTRPDMSAFPGSWE